MFNTIDPNSTKEQDLINRDFPTFNFDVLDGVEYEIDVLIILEGHIINIFFPNTTYYFIVFLKIFIFNKLFYVYL